jgi:hypothetical protein
MARLKQTPTQITIESYLQESRTMLCLAEIIVTTIGAISDSSDPGDSLIFAEFTVQLSLKSSSNLRDFFHSLPLSTTISIYKAIAITAKE